MKKILVVLIILTIFSALSAHAAAKNMPAAVKKLPINIGLRGGLGTDISGGIAAGANGNYQIDMYGYTTELGISFYWAKNTSTSTSGIHSYTDKTSLLVFGGLANMLLNYDPGRGGLFFVIGTGLAAISVNWSEESKTDTSLGTPLPGGGSSMSSDAFCGGSVFNLGIGYLFDNGLDLRFETPIIVVFGSPGRTPGVVPTFTVTGGIRI